MEMEESTLGKWSLGRFWRGGKKWAWLWEQGGSKRSKEGAMARSLHLCSYGEEAMAATMHYVLSSPFAASYSKLLPQALPALPTLLADLHFIIPPICPIWATISLFQSLILCFNLLPHLLSQLVHDYLCKIWCISVPKQISWRCYKPFHFVFATIFCIPSFNNSASSKG